MIKLKNVLYENVIEPHWFKGPVPASNIIVIKKFYDSYKILLVKRGGPTEYGKWSLPGGYQDTSAIPKAGNMWKPGKETPVQAAIRELQEETGLNISTLRDSIKNLGRFSHVGNPNDTEESWVRLDSFAILLPDNFDVSSIKYSDDAAETQWCDIRKIPPLAFNDNDLIKRAIQKLKQSNA